MLHQDFQVSVVQEEFFLMKVVDSARQLCLHVAYTPTKDGFLRNPSPPAPDHAMAESPGAPPSEATANELVRFPNLNAVANARACGTSKARPGEARALR